MFEIFSVFSPTTTNNGKEKECTFFSCEIIFYICVTDTWANFSFINNYEKKKKCALKCIKSHQMHLIRPTFGSQRIKLKIDPFGFVAHINCLILFVEENVMWRINDYHNMVVFVRIWKKIMISKCTLVREFSYWTGWDSTFPWKKFKLKMTFEMKLFTLVVAQRRLSNEKQQIIQYFNIFYR